MDLYNPTQNSVIVSSLKFLVAIGTMIYISMLFRHSEEKFIKSEYSNDTNHTVDATEVENMSFTHKPIEIQPHCPLYMNAILHEILVDLYVKREMCTPQDIYNLTKHKIPKITDHKKIAKSKESKGAMVVYLAVGLLMTSLCCAFVEVFKAKHQPTEKSKPGLNRTCSLADLTVLRHNRKELMRRDSVMDMGEHRASKLLGRKMSRPPLRLE